MQKQEQILDLIRKNQIAVNGIYHKFQKNQR